MNLYFDTSALVKFFHTEDGTDLIRDEANISWILEIAHLELLSAVYRRYRNNEMTGEQLTIALSGIKKETLRFNIEPLNNLVVKEAVALMKQYGKSYGLRTLNALHVAGFKLVADNDWKMVSSDEVMCTIIEKLGYASINPAKP